MVEPNHFTKLFRASLRQREFCYRVLWSCDRSCLHGPAASTSVNKGSSGMELCSRLLCLLFTAVSYTADSIRKTERSSVLWSAHYLLVFVCALCRGAFPV